MKTQNPISVFPVDDDKMYLKTLKHYIGEHFKSAVRIQAFTTGEGCLGEIEQPACADLVILDYYLNAGSSNALNGIDVLKRLKQINTDIKVIMLSAQDKLEIAAGSIKYGAYEYVVKSASTFVRTPNILKKLFVTINEAKSSKLYQKGNVVLAIIILILLLMDILYYNTG